MLNIILADLYRLTKSKSTAIFLGVATLIFVMVMNLSEVNMSPALFNIMVVSGLAVSSISISVISVIRVYCDDVSSGSIHHLFAKMSNKLYYLIAKYVVLAIYVSFCFLVLGIVFFAQMAITTRGFGGGISSYVDISSLAKFSFIAYIGTLTTAVISYNVLVLTRKSSIAILFVSLLASNFIDSLVELLGQALRPLSHVKEYMFTTYFMDTMSGYHQLRQYCAVALCYVVCSFVLQLITLKKTDFTTD